MQSFRMFLALLVIGLATALILLTVTIPFHGLERSPSPETVQWTVWLGVVFCSCVYVAGLAPEKLIPGVWQLPGVSSISLLVIATATMLAGRVLDRDVKERTRVRNRYHALFVAVSVSIMVIFVGTVIGTAEMPVLNPLFLAAMLVANGLYLIDKAHQNRNM